MDVKYLGTGHAYETPNSDCACDTCYTQRNSGDERDKRTNTSLAILGNSTEDYILVDCGDFLAQKKSLRNFLGRKEGDSLAKGMNLLLTHSHPDHVLGLYGVESGVRGAEKSVPTYLHEKCSERIDQMDMGFFFKFGTLGKNILDMENGVYRLAGIDVRPFKVDHKSFVAPGAVGYIFDSPEGKRLVYTGDFGEIPDLNPLTKGGKHIDKLVAECNWFNELEDRKDHMSFQSLLPYLEKLNPAELHLVHLGSDDELTKEEDMEKHPFKKRAKNPLAHFIPRTHNEWDTAVREILSQNPKLKHLAYQKDLISYDGMEFSF